MDPASGITSVWMDTPANVATDPRFRLLSSDQRTLFLLITRHPRMKKPPWILSAFTDLQSVVIDELGWGLERLNREVAAAAYIWPRVFAPFQPMHLDVAALTNDTQSLSAATMGALIDLLCWMWCNDHRGFLCDPGGQPIARERIPWLFRASLANSITRAGLTLCLHDIEQSNYFSRTGPTAAPDLEIPQGMAAGVWYCPWMVRQLIERRGKKTERRKKKELDNKTAFNVGRSSNIVVQTESNEGHSSINGYSTQANPTQPHQQQAPKPPFGDAPKPGQGDGSSAAASEGKAAAAAAEVSKELTSRGVDRRGTDVQQNR
jgi:hypothetical protein